MTHEGEVVGPIETWEPVEEELCSTLGRVRVFPTVGQADALFEWWHGLWGSMALCC